MGGQPGVLRPQGALQPLAGGGAIVEAKLGDGDVIRGERLVGRLLGGAQEDRQRLLPLVDLGVGDALGEEPPDR